MDDLVLAFILDQFKVKLKKVTISPINEGFINDTYLISDLNGPHYVLQKINHTIFTDVNALQLNIKQALHVLRNSDYTTFSIIKTLENSLVYQHNDTYWRLYSFVPNSEVFSYTSDVNIAFEAGRLLGNFHSLLKHVNIDNFTTTIANLNHLPSKINEFQEALEKTSKQLHKTASNEITFALTNKAYFETFYTIKLPCRLCHNDTKLNNILFDKTSKKALCLVDLDTLMAGYFHYDFGDAVRTVVSESKEDEQVITNINFNLTLFEEFVKGMFTHNFKLTEKEIKLLPISCALMPFMHGLRALTDYLNGNIYYKVSYKNQNLDRCISLFEFTKKALKYQDDITYIIEKQLIQNNF